MRAESETVSERIERLRAALEDVQRTVADSSEKCQRLLEEIRGSGQSTPPPRPRDTGKRRSAR